MSVLVRFARAGSLLNYYIFRARAVYVQCGVDGEYYGSAAAITLDHDRFQS